MASGVRPTPWEVIRSAVVRSDRWITLRADDCRDARGRDIGPYYVLEQPEWVSVLALTVGGEAILVEEYHHGAGIVSVGLVSGAVEDGESPREAAVRELREETGYAGDDVVDLGQTWANWGNQTNRVHHFLVRGCCVGTQDLDGGEIIEVALASVERLGDRLMQSYNQLTWYKARAHL
ncbi:NUDIX hydrolase [Microbacterium protaetiae]|uniref:NUDIX hydrolase n=1 Tax=Microbacterium protaetiae TaxID=2509458 RepID=A0A4P6EJI7_9MICO|nr:NUDIX hydrolase [Microbacterium protaetiae]